MVIGESWGTLGIPHCSPEATATLVTSFSMSSQAPNAGNLSCSRFPNRAMLLLNPQVCEILNSSTSVSYPTSTEKLSWSSAPRRDESPAPARTSFCLPELCMHGFPLQVSNAVFFMLQLNGIQSSPLILQRGHRMPVRGEEETLWSLLTSIAESFSGDYTHLQMSKDSCDTECRRFLEAGDKNVFVFVPVASERRQEQVEHLLLSVNFPHPNI